MRFHIMICVAMLIATAIPATAQISVGASDFPNSGSFNYGEADGATFSVGNAGPSQTWTFGQYTWDMVTVSEYVNPADTPYGGSFPTATRAVFSHLPGGPFDGTYQYERITSDAYAMLGFAAEDTMVVYDAPRVLAPLPVDYNDSWTSVLRREFSPQPGIDVVIVDSMIAHVDGWGTLQTPYGSHAVLRLFLHHWTSVTMNGFPISDTETLEYLWINQQALDVVSVTSEDDEPNPNFTSGYLQMLGAPVAAEPVRGPVASAFSVGQNYPNPFNPLTVLPVELEKSGRVTVDIYDETGRLVEHRDYVLSPGAHQLPVDGQRWSAGAYFARVSTSDAMQTVKMMLLK